MAGAITGFRGGRVKTTDDAARHLAEPGKGRCYGAINDLSNGTSETNQRAPRFFTVTTLVDV